MSEKHLRVSEDVDHFTVYLFIILQRDLLSVLSVFAIFHVVFVRAG